MELLLATVAGLGAGAAHVYLGVDHLAALAALSRNSARGSWRLGLRWGLGHSLGVILVAAALLGLRETVDITWLAGVSEILVGVVLIGIGVLGARSALNQQVHSHRHQHDGTDHVHLHVHSPSLAHPPAGDDHAHEDGLLHGHTSFVAGVIQGLAGMSFLWGILPAMALTYPAALFYLAGFAAGSITAMCVFTAGLSRVLSEIEQRAAGFVFKARLAACLLCGLVGMLWLAIPVMN